MTILTLIVFENEVAELEMSSKVHERAQGGGATHNTLVGMHYEEVHGGRTQEGTFRGVRSS